MFTVQKSVVHTAQVAIYMITMVTKTWGINYKGRKGAP